MSELLHDILKSMSQSQKEAQKESNNEAQKEDGKEVTPENPQDEEYVLNMPREYYLNHITPRLEEFGLPKNAKPVDFVDKLITDKMQNKQAEVQAQKEEQKEEQKEIEKEESDIVKVTKLIQAQAKPISEPIHNKKKWYIKYKWALILLLGIIVLYLIYRFFKKNKPIAKEVTNINTNANTNVNTNGDWCSQANK